MPSSETFPKSVVLHFPPSIYQKTGAAEMLPHLLEILNQDDLRCAQFLRGGRVRLSFREKVRDHLTEGLRFGEEDIPVTRHAEKLTVVYVRDIPYEVSSDDVLGFLGTFGEVLTVERSVSPDFPSLCTGNRIVKIVLQESLPYFRTIFGFECRVWYREQSSQCFVCREFGHRAQSYPLSGLCRRCRRPRHKARECTQAWDPAPASIDDGSTCTVVPTDPVEDSVPIAVNEVPDPEPPDVQIERVPDPEPLKVQTVSTYVDIPVLIPVPSTSPPAKAVAKAPSSPAARIQVAFHSCLTVFKDHASDSVYVKIIRDRLWRIQTGKVDKMTTPELNSWITNALWEE